MIGGWLLMLKNKLLQKDNNIVRVLETENDKALIVNCIKRVVPQWINTAELTEYTECSINDLSHITEICTHPTAVVAFNPDNVSSVWVIENSKYTEFILIESRFTGKSLEEVQQMQSAKKQLIQSVNGENLQAKIDLAEHIKVISKNSAVGDANIKYIRETRQRERTKQHIDIMGGAE